MIILFLVGHLKCQRLVERNVEQYFPEPKTSSDVSVVHKLELESDLLFFPAKLDQKSELIIEVAGD